MLCSPTHPPPCHLAVLLSLTALLSLSCSSTTAYLAEERQQWQGGSAAQGMISGSSYPACLQCCCLSGRRSDIAQGCFWSSFSTHGGEELASEEAMVGLALVIEVVPSLSSSPSPPLTCLLPKRQGQFFNRSIPLAPPFPTHSKFTLSSSKGGFDPLIQFRGVFCIFLQT